MPYDESLAERVRKAVSHRSDVVEKKMFGGLSFMVNGYMACGVLKDDLMVRVGPDRFQDALARPGARPMDITGRPMKGFVFVSREGHESDEALAEWMRLAVEFAESQPPR